jgi:hypothetical protein
MGRENINLYYVCEVVSSSESFGGCLALFGRQFFVCWEFGDGWMQEGA